jgi:protein-tyrosine-phosphatase
MIAVVLTQCGGPCDRSFSADAVLNKVCPHWNVDSATGTRLHHQSVACGVGLAPDNEACVQEGLLLDAWTP